VAREWKGIGDVLSIFSVAGFVVEVEADSRRAVAGGKNGGRDKAAELVYPVL
jgi:hypothetical protein